MRFDPSSRSTPFEGRRGAARALILALGLSLGVLGGCHNEDDDDTNFNGFVLNLFDDTSDTGTPVAINGTSFDFSDDPHQFDELFD